MPQFHYLGNWPGASSRSDVAVAVEGTSLRMTKKGGLTAARWSVTIPLADIAALEIVTGAQAIQGQLTEFYDFMAVWQVRADYLLLTINASGARRQVALRGRQADLDTLYGHLLKAGRPRTVDDESSVRDAAGTAQT